MLIILTDHLDNTDKLDVTPTLLTITAIIWGMWIIFCASLAGIALL